MAERSIVYDPDHSRKASKKLFKGDVQDFSVDANMWCVRDGGTTLSSAAWSVVQGNNISVGSDTEASNVSTAAVTASDTGNSLVKVTLTLADGQVGIQYIEFLVPVVETQTSDYQ